MVSQVFLFWIFKYNQENETFSDQDHFYENKKALDRTDLESHITLEDAKMTSREIAT